MEKFKDLKSIPAHLPLLNIDTDMIIPKQFLKTIKRTGLGKILLTGKNFGCGSSREHAPWALLDFGIRCVISPSFADIFYNNCFKNGILPIVLDEKTIQELSEYSKRSSVIEIKIQEQEIIYGNKVAKFDLDSFKKKCLIEGIDDIGLSLEKISNIKSYEEKISNQKPWLTNND